MSPHLSQLTETLLTGPGPSCVPAAVYSGPQSADHRTSRSTIPQPHGRSPEPAAAGHGHGEPLDAACQWHRFGRHGDVLRQPDRARRPGADSGQRGVRPADGDVATRLRAEVDTVEFPWGTPVVPEAVRGQLAKKSYRIVAVVHAETSTGVRSPVAEIGSFVKQTGALYLIDTVTSLGGIPVTMDEWGCDVMYSGTQKCLSCPPGLSPVSFRTGPWPKLTSRVTKVPNWYLDAST